MLLPAFQRLWQSQGSSDRSKVKRSNDSSKRLLHRQWETRACLLEELRGWFPQGPIPKGNRSGEAPRLVPSTFAMPLMQSQQTPHPEVLPMPSWHTAEYAAHLFLPCYKSTACFACHTALNCFRCFELSDMVILF